MSRLLHILLLLLLADSVFAQVSGKPYARERMATAITAYQRMAEANGWNTFPANLLIRPGDSSKYVNPLQENLILTGDLPLDSANLNNRYTSAVKKAVRAYQARHGLITDGVLGPKTIKELNVPLTQRLSQLQQNLSRWDTAFFSVPQPYIVINLPDYTLQVVENDKTVLNMRVIIGEPDLKTYPILSKLNMVVMYPYWYIPKSIAVKEIVPLLRRNPGYLNKKRMRLETNTSQGWIKVNPYTINWHQITESNYTYRIVQLSGKENELGEVKFLFPNRLPQYMHDTPHKELFSYPDRTFSHGCIRLEKPMELADLILAKGNGYSPEKIEKAWNTSPPNYYLKVKKPLPLHIVYLTAWVDEFEKVQFREDMYGYFKASLLSAE